MIEWLGAPLVLTNGMWLYLIAVAVFTLALALRAQR